MYKAARSPQTELGGVYLHSPASSELDWREFIYTAQPPSN